jgi:fucose 4-O-acetylase-like acetyltransferase
LQIVALAVPEMGWLFRGAVLASIVIALATPFAWQGGGDWPVWIGSLVSGRTRSVFPLFPYAAFTLAGAAWGYRHALARERGEEGSFLSRSTWLCILLCLGSLAIAALPLPEIYSDFWYTSPLFLSLRIGILALLAIGARRAETWIPQRLRRVLVIIGKESLLIYVVHLLVLYGSAFNPETNLAKVAGVALSLRETLLIWLAFTAAMVLLGLWWDWWKRNREREARGLKWLLAGYCAYRLIFG